MVKPKDFNLKIELTKLISKLEDYDFESKQVIEHIITGNTKPSISSRLKELDQVIEAYDFDQALQLAQSILDNEAQ